MSRSDTPGNGGQFPKGRSGNPKGRPGKTPPPRSSAFDVVVERTLTVTRNGVTQDITMDEALQHRVYQDALDGKRLAIRQVVKWIVKREAWYARHAPKDRWGRVSLKHSPDPENARHALELLGIVSRDETFDETDPYWPRHLLEPWAVQAALDRRRGATAISEGEVNEIRRSTRDFDTLRWPRGSRE